MFGPRSKGSVIVMPASQELLTLVNGFKPATKEDNVRLWQAAVAGDGDSLDEMVCRNLKLLLAVANEFEDRGPLGVDDLVQEAALLMVRRYIPRYTPDRGAFSSFLVRSLRRDLIKIVSRDGNFALGMPTRHLTEIARLYKEGKHAEAMRRSHSMETIGEPMVVDERTPDDIAEQREMLAELPRAMMSALTPREMDIVNARFGVPPYTGVQSCKVIGERWDLSKERIRQIEKKALKKLRTAFAVV